MKKLKPCICIPTSGQVKARFALSLAGLAGYFATHPIAGIEEQSMKLFILESSLVADNREKLVRRSLEEGGTHVVFIDDDISFPADILHRLLGHNLPVVGCNYPFRTPRGGFTAGYRDGRQVATHERSSGLEEVAWIGFGFSLIRRDVFESLSEPWFVHNWSDELQGFTTEDVPFCQRAADAGYRIMVDHDASKTIGHLGNYEFRWNDPIIHPRTETAP